jgi:hypothetical protein
MSVEAMSINQLETGLLFRWQSLFEGSHRMTIADLGERAALLEQQVDARKLNQFILNLERRIETTERRIEQHEIIIEQYRQETTAKSAVLKNRICGLERLVMFLADMLVALITFIAGGVIAGYVGGDQLLLPSIGLVVLSFGFVFLGTDFLFKQVEAWCLEYKPPATAKKLAAAMRESFTDLDRQDLRETMRSEKTLPGIPDRKMTNLGHTKTKTQAGAHLHVGVAKNVYHVE